MKAAGTLLSLLLCNAPVATAQQTIPEQPPPFRTGVELVTVDASVLDRQGRPLRGLRADDFVVSVAGQPRRVVSAEFVDWTAAAPPGPVDPDAARISSNEAARSGRVFVFVVDQNSLEPGSARQIASGASGLFSRLTSHDRSALMVLPVGPSVELTWSHDRVRDAIQRVGGMMHNGADWEGGSLAEARDIASRNQFVLRRASERECGGPTFGGSGGGFGNAGGASGGAQGGGEGSGASGGGGASPGGGATGSDGGSAPARGGSGGGSPGGAGSGFGGGSGECSRNVQMQAEMMWRSAQATSLTSVAALRGVLASLAQVGGDKVVVLISGGLPLDERDQMSLLSTVAADAAAARATLFTFFVPAATVTASRRAMSSSPAADEQMQGWPLETLASLTGGASYRVHAGAEAAFNRLGGELAGYYRLGVERTPGDLDGKARPLKVQVSRDTVTVRTRATFDVRTYEDRDWSARLNAALGSPAQSTGIGLRLTSYVAADRDNPSRVRLVLAGEASRVANGDASFQVVIRDGQGKQVISEEQPLGTATEERLPFSVNVAVSPGSYTVRMAVMDSAGHVGSVDHRADAWKVPLGPLAGFGPLLVRVPAAAGARPVVALDGVRTDDRLAVQMDLTGDAGLLSGTDVVFDVASTLDGPALVSAPATLSPDTARGAALAEAVVDVRLLPPGAYVARAKVWSGGEPVGELRRPFTISGAPRADTDAAALGGVAAAHVAPSNLAARASRSVPPFAIDEVLAPPVLGAFLDRVAARPDSASPVIRALLDRTRAAGVRELAVPDAVNTEAPAAAAFLKGLVLLRDQKLESAASQFRDAIRASPDFYPAMVYLGACYAAGGRHREAAGAWRTALIKLDDAVAVHALLAEALLRDGRGDQAFQVLEQARGRWPDHEDLNRRFASAAIAAGRYVEGLDAIDDLVASGAQDEPLLALGLLVLYEAFANGQAVVSEDADRVRMTRFADEYRARGGPSLALVETWLSAATPK
jgi:VWFA-related protein